MTLVVLCIQLLLFANNVLWRAQSLCTLMTDPSYSYATGSDSRASDVSSQSPRRFVHWISCKSDIPDCLPDIVAISISIIQPNSSMHCMLQHLLQKKTHRKNTDNRLNGFKWMWPEESKVNQYNLNARYSLAH